MHPFGRVVVVVEVTVVLDTMIEATAFDDRPMLSTTVNCTPSQPSVVGAVKEAKAVS